MNLSYIREIGPVAFPQWTGERVYMRPFTKAAGLPPHLRRWQSTIGAMLSGVDTEEPIYLMIDQSEVHAGQSQRRPGVHIDGYWIAGSGKHGPKPPGHCGSWDTPAPGWKHVNFSRPEALILASDVEASRAFLGHWEGEVAEGGDCRAVSLGGLAACNLLANHAYAGNVSMLHESLPVSCVTRRTLVRLNVPGWSPETL